MTAANAAPALYLPIGALVAPPSGGRTAASFGTAAANPAPRRGSASRSPRPHRRQASMPQRGAADAPAVQRALRPPPGAQQPRSQSQLTLDDFRRTAMIFAGEEHRRA